MQFYHPQLPILRKQDPNDCYEAYPTLFWAIIYIACRRFCRDEDLFTALIEDLTRTPWQLFSSFTNVCLESVHAVILVCAWPLQGIRFPTDPCPSMMNFAMIMCMQSGMHMGMGASPEFCCGPRSIAKCTDEQASATWLATCALANRYDLIFLGALPGLKSEGRY